MMMDSEKYYRGLTEKELRLLIQHNNNDALDEFLRRKETGEIPSNWVSIDDFIKECNAKKKAS